MIKRSESYFKGHDNEKLFLQMWTHPEAQASIIITHGQAEHSECYQRLVDGLTKHIPLNFIAWDLRGHGKSNGLRGYARDFDDYVLDYHCFYNEGVKLDFVQKLPLIALGHSMGGLIQTCALSEGQFPLIKAQILSSPLFGLNLAVPLWKESAATWANKIAPKITLGNEIKYDQLTRDLEVIKEYEKDSYRHNKISPSVFLGMKREMENNPSRALNITIPTFLNISSSDPIVSSSSAIQFFESIASQNKVLKLVEGGKHELYNDICRDEVFKSISDFCKTILTK